MHIIYRVNKVSNGSGAAIGDGGLVDNGGEIGGDFVVSNGVFRGAYI